MSAEKLILLQRSERRQPAGARHVAGTPASDEKIEVTVVLRSAAGPAARRKAVESLSSQFPRDRSHLGRHAFLRVHGARNRDIARVVAFARGQRLDVVNTDSAGRFVVLSGTVANFARAFAVNFTLHRLGDHAYRSHRDGVRLPAALSGVVEAVLGLDNRMLVSHHVFLHAHPVRRHVDPEEVARVYKFPEKARGKGQTIAIIELGGGFYESDIAAYFSRRGLRKPKITVVEIQGQRNDPAPPQTVRAILEAMGVSGRDEPAGSPALDPAEARRALWTVETTLDLELAASFARAAHIIVYFAPNNAQGKYRALTAALHNRTHPADVISCSWGAAEVDLPDDFVHSVDQVFQDAVLKGVTICFSSGDRGGDPDSQGRPRVHFPASSPHVLSCGGTHWRESGEVLNEVVWRESLPKTVAQSGGGVSKTFALPAWQSAAGVESRTRISGRGVPDVAGKADMVSGYCMLVAGFDVTMGGTSAAAPMWAGLIARINQQMKRNIGYITPLLYHNASQKSLRDITEGSNGTYEAGPGWDACTGLGTPDGKKLLAALKRSPA